MDIFGRVRRWSRTAGDDRQIRMTNFESQAVAQVEPPGVECTRAACRFLLGNSAAVTGIANVTALPTTAAQWALFNGEAAGGKTYYLEELGMFLTSGTPGVSGMLLACIYSAPTIATGSFRAGCSIGPAGGVSGPTGSALNSRAIVAVSQTITNPAAPNWFPVATNPSPNVTAFAAQVFLEHRNIQGRIAIPPQHALGLAVVGPAGTTPLYAPFAQWVELATDNE
jgi:hypothetical protein